MLRMKQKKEKVKPVPKKKVDAEQKKRKAKGEAKEESQCGAEEWEDKAIAKEAFKEEGYEKKINKFKTRVSMMYSESILVGCDVR